jgi:DNA-binding NtrC family response regulator
MKLGAYDYVAKPYRMAEIDVLVRRAWEKRGSRARTTLLQSQRLSLAEAQSEIVTQYAPMQAVLALVERVARSDSAVLIMGESGTGKELIARMLHRLSHRVTGPLVDINCAAIPDALVESELFGHERGAHAEASTRGSGSSSSRMAARSSSTRSAAARSKVQGKLLRALEHSGRSTGLAARRRSNPICASLRRAIGSRAARRERDFPRAISTIASTRSASRCRRCASARWTFRCSRGTSCEFGGRMACRSLSPDAIDALQAYPWPGNVRELRNVIERAALVATGSVIHAHDVPLGGLPASQWTRD